MSQGSRIPLEVAQNVANDIIEQIKPHCIKCDIAGSIRRQRPTVGDIEIVCLPKPYVPDPLFRSGLALVVEQWEKVKGELPCKYTQRLLPSGIKLDLFMPDPLGYGLVLAIRTGSAEWCKRVLAPAWVRAGYHSKDGVLCMKDGFAISARNERELFSTIGLSWTDPKDREVTE